MLQKHKSFKMIFFYIFALILVVPNCGYFFMQYKWIKKRIVTYVYVFSSALPACITANPISNQLIHCYRGNETEAYFPNTLQLLIELIRKIEDVHPTNHNVRTLSAVILHRLRIDGIEKAPGISESELVTPYGARGIMGPKFRLLLQMVSDTASSIDLEKALSASEICMLHRLISISVEPYERGDEESVCPIALMPGNNYSPRASPRHKK